MKHYIFCFCILFCVVFSKAMQVDLNALNQELLTILDRLQRSAVSHYDREHIRSLLKAGAHLGAYSHCAYEKKINDLFAKSSVAITGSVFIAPRWIGYYD